MVLALIGEDTFSQPGEGHNGQHAEDATQEKV